MKRPFRVPQKTSDLKRLAGLATGLLFLLAGWIIYTGHGYDSSLLFFIGFLLLPLGVITLGISLLGSSEEPHH